ncbi:MAG: hypothetical protein ACOZCO_08850 [Bacteroidota bacterium]
MSVKKSEIFFFVVDGVKKYLEMENFVFKKQVNVFWITYSHTLFALKFEPFRFNTEDSFHFTIVVGLYDPVYADIVSQNKRSKKMCDCMVTKDLFDFGARKEGFKIKNNSSVDAMVNDVVRVLEKYYISFIRKMSIPIEKRLFLMNGKHDLILQLTYCCYLLLDNKIDIARKILEEKRYLINDYWMKKIFESKQSELKDLMSTGKLV